MNNRVIKKMMLSMLLISSGAPLAYGMKKSNNNIKIVNIVQEIQACEAHIKNAKILLKDADFTNAKNTLETILWALKAHKNLVSTHAKNAWNALKETIKNTQADKNIVFIQKCKNNVDEIDLLFSKTQTSNISFIPLKTPKQVQTPKKNVLKKNKTQKEPLKNKEQNPTKKTPAPQSTPKKPVNNEEKMRLARLKLQKKIEDQNKQQIELTTQTQKKAPVLETQPKPQEPQQVIEIEKIVPNNTNTIIDDEKMDIPVQIDAPQIIIEEKVEITPVNTNKKKDIEKPKQTPVIENEKEIVFDTISIFEKDEEELVEEELILDEIAIVEQEKQEKNKIQESNKLNDCVVDIIKNNKLKPQQELSNEEQFSVEFLKHYSKICQALKNILDLKKGAHLNKKTLDEAYYNLYIISLKASTFTAQKFSGMKINNLAKLFNQTFALMLEKLTLYVDTIKDLFEAYSVQELVALFKEICPELKIDAIQEKLTLKFEILHKDCTEILTDYEKKNIEKNASLVNKVATLIAIFNDQKTELSNEKNNAKPKISGVKNRMNVLTQESRKLVIAALLEVLNAQAIPNQSALLKVAVKAFSYTSGRNYYNLNNRYELKK